MGAIGVIAFNAFRESLRDKILYNLVLFAGLLIGLSVLLADLSITEHHKVIADMGLAAINLIGVIIAIFVGISLVNKEIERRTIYTIMARPISRASFIMGKYLGLALTLFVNMAIMLAVFLLTLWLNHVPIQPSIFQAVALIFVEILVVTAIALFFSTFTSTTLSAIFTLGFYVIGHLTADLRAMVTSSESGPLKSGTPSKLMAKTIMAARPHNISSTNSTAAKTASCALLMRHAVSEDSRLGRRPCSSSRLA